MASGPFIPFNERTCKLDDAHFQSFYSSFDAVSGEHLPGEDPHRTNTPDETNKHSSIYDLGFGLVGVEELDAPIDSSRQKDDSPYPDQ